MNTIRAVIVDDEPLAQDGLRLLLEEQSNISVDAVCSSGVEAVKAVVDLNPDVLFLDIEMPRMNGFDVIAKIGAESMPQVIFVTAYDQYAVEAFNCHAVDYLLKPVHKDRLKESLARLRKSISQHDIVAHSEKLGSLLEMFRQAPAMNRSNMAENSVDGRIIVKSQGHVFFLSTSDIVWVEASGDYVTIHAQDRSHLLRETMNNMEKRLLPHGFMRVHRSSIVNLQCVREIRTCRSNDYQVVLNDGTTLNLGRSFKDDLYASLSSED